EAAFEDRRRRAAAWLTRFEQLDDAACANFEERIDRDLIRSNLRGRAILADWQMWRRQPETYLGPGLGGIFTLFLHRLKPEPALAPRKRVACRRCRGLARARPARIRPTRRGAAPLRPGDRGHRRLARGAPETEPGPSADARSHAPDLRRLDRPRPRLPARARLG